jgi:hypothetical protein
VIFQGLKEALIALVDSFHDVLDGLRAKRRPPVSACVQFLHRRVALGETLSPAEQAMYQSGCQELDAAERLDGNLERLRELRAQIAVVETEQRRLQAQEAELDTRILALEARLDTRTRHLLGISN